MKRWNKTNHSLLLSTLITSVFFAIILPNEFALRGNFANKQQLTGKYSLFFIPLVSLGLYLFLIFIEKFYKQSNDLAKSYIVIIAQPILMFISFAVNLYFNLEALTTVQKDHLTNMNNSFTIFCISAVIVLILFGLSFLFYQKKSSIKAKK